MNIPFQKKEVEDYERKRYRGIDQRLVHAREERILRKILNRVGGNIRCVLDIPCGYGRFSPLLLEQGRYLVSCDLSFHMVKRAGYRGRNLGLSAGIAADGKGRLPFKENVFDFLLSMRFFHHLHQREDRKAVLEEFFRISREWVVLSYYQRNFLHILQRRLRRKIKRSRTQIKMVSRREIEEEFTKVGFKAVRIYSLFRGVHSQYIALLKKA